jgi:hypothetical protein
MFKIFPEFSKLTLDDKEEYDALVKDYPPIADITFASLVTWHNTYDHMSVALMQGNIILPYWLPGDEKDAGLTLVGTTNVDECLCAIFDHLKTKSEPARVVSVPEFVVASIRYPELFKIKPARLFDEYILAVSKYYPLTNMTSPRRFKLERTLKRIGEEYIDARSLHLNSPEDRELIWNAFKQWQPKNINNYGKVEEEAARLAVKNAKRLGIQNLCVFVNGVLHGFCFYEVSNDGKYATILQIKATHKRSLGFELVGYEIAKHFYEKGIEYVNLNSDMGILKIRVFMLTLGPVNFFRKYIIEPAT